MDRAEASGLGIATAAHAVLFAILSVGLLSHSKPLPAMGDHRKAEGPKHGLPPSGRRG